MGLPMPLFLAVRATKPGTAPRELELIGRDLAIGRSPEADVSLPDPTQQVSSRHCQVQFRDGGYVLADSSTNGTLLNGVRIAAPQRLKAGDVIGVGHYVIDVAERAAAAKAADVRMDLNSWDRAPARSATQAPPPASVPAPSAGMSPSETSLAQALARLVATRARQRGELGVRSPDPLAGNPLAGDAGRAAAPLSDAAVTAAVDEIERHHAATLRAMRGAFRATLDRISPEAIGRTAKAADTGDARDAALWRAYVAAFDGAGPDEQGFVESFARAFRDAYEDLARDTPSSAARRPS